MRDVILNGEPVGPGHPAVICAELGINHSGDIEIVKAMLTMAKQCGVTLCKLQKRAVYESVPPAMWDVPKDTPWGQMSYLEYKQRMEFTPDQCGELWQYAQDMGIELFWSVWDTTSYVALKERLPDVVAWKIPSAKLTNSELLQNIVDSLKRQEKDTPIILSTGMSTLQEIDRAMLILREHPNVIICHCTSTYPCPPDELNLRMIPVLQARYDIPTGYSGHERGIQVSVAAAALGACFIERHFTLDRTMWGTDQAASIEPPGLRQLVRDVRVVESALGDGIKRVYASELPIMAKLRGTVD